MGAGLGTRDSGLGNGAFGNAAKSPLIALVAGEDSGDVLGADLAEALRRRLPGVRMVGIGGPRMAAAGVDCWHDIDELSVMGIAEVLRHLPRLLWLRRRLGSRLIRTRPDAVIGIDAPDFNLGLERRLKQAGLTTLHYVSPSVWAWREKRAEHIGRSADRVLCLFPMEPAIYARHDVDACFVGHPLAERFALNPDRQAAREQLGLSANAPVLALLPGSRGSEIDRLGDDFIDTADRLASQLPGLRVLLPAANPRCFNALQTRLAERAAHAAQSGAKPVIELLNGQADQTLLAADVALLASGTVALEAMLAKCPMVVAYRIAPLTYGLIRSLKLMTTSLYSLPNVLAGEELVPERMQADCHPAMLAETVLSLFNDAGRRQHMRAEFTRLHRVLRGDDGQGHPADRAARAVLDLLPEPSGHA
ncbi:MAG: lipid-A-disaccharide synthase [Rhodanobacteraceae bacterium]